MRKRPRSWPRRCSGVLDHDEFRELCHQLNPTMTDAEIDISLRRIDFDDDGYITLDEFKDWCVFVSAATRLQVLNIIFGCRWGDEDELMAASARTTEAKLQALDLKTQLALRSAEADMNSKTPDYDLIASKEGTRWKCVSVSDVHRDFDIYSDKTGVIQVGEVIEAIETRANENGQMRILSTHGWTTRQTGKLVTDKRGKILVLKGDVQFVATDAIAPVDWWKEAMELFGRDHADLAEPALTGDPFAALGLQPMSAIWWSCYCEHLQEISAQAHFCMCL